MNSARGAFLRARTAGLEASARAGAEHWIWPGLIAARFQGNEQSSGAGGPPDERAGKEGLSKQVRRVQVRADGGTDASRRTRTRPRKSGSRRCRRVWARRRSADRRRRQRCPKVGKPRRAPSPPDDRPCRFSFPDDAMQAENAQNGTHQRLFAARGGVCAEPGAAEAAGREGPGRTLSRGRSAR